MTSYDALDDLFYNKIYYIKSHQFVILFLRNFKEWVLIYEPKYT